MPEKDCNNMKKGAAKLIILTVLIVLLLVSTSIASNKTSKTNSASDLSTANTVLATRTIENNTETTLNENITIKESEELALIKTNNKINKTTEKKEIKTEIKDKQEKNKEIKDKQEKDKQEKDKEVKETEKKQNKKEQAEKDKTKKNSSNKEEKNEKKPKVLSINIKDNKNKNQAANIIIKEKQIKILPDKGPVKKIILNNIQSTELNLGLDDAPENIPAPLGKWEEVYAINPTQIKFTNATITAKAKGTKLYKCKEWDFENQKCNGKWKFFKKITPGKEYSFTLTPEDPGFGEILATDAVHLNDKYEFISNIYDEIKEKDSVWSEPIFEGETVRVTFEKNLTNGCMIDVFARSNKTIAYFDIYEAGTDNKIGMSGIIEYPEMQFIELKDLTKPINTVDFKIIKVLPDPEDNSTNIDINTKSFLEFDFIHDDAINLTHADGLVAYQERNVKTPRYRTWNQSNEFSVELSAQNVGKDITWVVARANPKRDEIILGTEDKARDVNIQIYTNKTWSNLLEVSKNVKNSAQRGFDIGIEQNSGDVLIVYENSAFSDNKVAYRIWNGTEYSAEKTLTTSLINSPARWISLIPKSNSDKIMLLIHNSARDLYAILWNGTDFDKTKEKNLSLSTTSNNEQHFAFAWEEQSNKGLVVYGEGSKLVYRTYDPITGFNNTENTIELNNGLDAVRMCSDKNSNYIGIIWQDSGNDVQARIWNSTVLSNSSNSPVQDKNTESNGANNANIDCAWLNSTTAMFGFIDKDALSIDYFFFTKNNTWNTNDLTNTLNSGNFATDDIKSLRFVKHPTTKEIMAVAMDIKEDITLTKWNGSQFTRVPNSPIECQTEVNNGAQEGVMFVWDQFDSAPEVSEIKPSGSNFFTGSNISINSTVKDNIQVDTVLAKITLPNNSIDTIVLLDDNSDNVFNATFSHTSLAGVYTIRIIANDTEGNTNNYSTSSFNVIENQFPNVTNILPQKNSEFNISNIIEIAANASDDQSIKNVIANITFPNSTLSEINLTNIAGTNKFNSSFTAPALTGVYTVTIIAKDVSNNVNNTEKTNFTVKDVMHPKVKSIHPAMNSAFNVSDTIEITANVTDDAQVDSVIASITLPNNTIENITLTDPDKDNKFKALYTIQPETGVYEISIFANDTNGNINNTEKTNFTAQDSNKPTILAQGCKPEHLNLTQTVVCNATAADDVGIDTVWAEIVFPNSTRIVKYAENNSKNNFFLNFSRTEITGKYDVIWFANDTNNNTNSDNDTFFVHDPVAPEITIFSLKENFTTNNNIVVFNFSATDNYDISLNCSLNIDNSSTIRNISVQNNTPEKIIVSSINEGEHEWNITCWDKEGNYNSSKTRQFTIDQSHPNFISLTTNPDNEDDLDPGTFVNVFANLTDNLTSVNTVILQYKLSNETIYKNISMSLDSGLFNATFNASSPGKYNLRVWANDSAGNYNTSNLVNISVFFDRTWTRTPADFATKNSDLFKNVSLGELIINNTGDFELNFSIISDSNNTVFNDSANFSLAPKQVKTLKVNDSATIAGTKIITLTINAEPDAQPSSQTTTGKIIAAKGQPVIIARFETPDSENLTVKQGQSNVDFQIKIQNIGEGNATDVNLSISLPNNWVITYGDSFFDIGELNSGDNETYEIEVTIPSNTQLGNYIVNVNTSGLNESGSDLQKSGLAFGDSVTLTVVSKPKKLGTGGGRGGGSGSSGAGSSSGSASSSGGGGQIGGPVIEEKGEEIIHTTQSLIIPRGLTESIPLKIKNVYENSVLENIKIEVIGFMSRYVKVKPKINLSQQVYVETKTLKLKQGSTDYFNFSGLEKHTIKVLNITSDTAKITIKSKPRNLTLRVGETIELDFNEDGINDAALYLKDIENNEINLKVYKIGLPDPEKIQYKEEREYLLSIFVPPYMEKQKFNATLKITADIVPINPELAGFKKKQLTEYRTLIIKIIETSEETAETGLEKALQDINLMKKAGYPTKRLKILLEQAKEALKEKDFDLAHKLTERINKLRKAAFKADKIIKKVQQGINKAKLRKLETYETQKALMLAIKSFKEEDFESALKRAKDAKLTLMLETKGLINLVWLFTKYWWIIIPAFIVIIALLALLHKKLEPEIISHRIKNIKKEEEIIKLAMKKIKEEHKKGKIKTRKYQNISNQYKIMLKKLEQTKTKLNKKIKKSKLKANKKTNKK